MGIFNFFKNMFRKTISLNDIDKSQVVALNKSNAKIKFGTKLNVPENFVCVLVYKNKITDVFKAGSYKLDVPTMPLLSRIEKLTKPNKKGDLPKNFRADVYYVNLGIIENQNFENALVHLKDKHYKNLSVRMAGTFSFQIIDPEEFMDAMFTQYGVLRNQVVRYEISYWISKLVSRKVKKNSPGVFELYARETSCFDGLIEYINDDVFDCGIKLSKIDITDVKFPKKVYKKVTLSYDELKEKKPTQYIGEMDALPNPVTLAEEKNFENQSNSVYLDEAKQIEAEQNLKEKTITAEVRSANIDENINFDEDNYDYTLIQNVLKETSSQNADENIAEQSQFDMPSQNTLVIDLDEPIEKTIEYKKCPKCGAFNAKDSEICFSCKTKL